MSVTRDLYNNTRFMTSITPAVYNSDTTGTAVDTANFESVMCNVHVGNSADTLSGSNTIALELEESSDNSTFTDVAVADMIGEAGTTASQFNLINAPAEDTAVFVVGYQGDLRYLRPLLNYSGSHSTGTPIGAQIVLGHAAVRPITVQQANRS